MSTNQPPQILKPVLRGHFHQAAFFLAFGACIMMIVNAREEQAFAVTLIYSFSLVGMFGISALYHRPHWNPYARTWLKRFDHAAIFFLIAGTGTPISRFALESGTRREFLIVLWVTAAIGMVQSLFWTKAPKWISICLYVICGWLAGPYIPELASSLGTLSLGLLIGGGVLYTVGALIYAFKRPNPFPRVFGYHEIFHLFVVFAALLHFVVIARLVN